MNIFTYAKSNAGLSKEEIRSSVHRSLEHRHLRRVLIIPPDCSRYHSGGGFIACTYYQALTQQNIHVDVMPALGTHEPLTPTQTAMMFPGIPYKCFLHHNWRTDVVELGKVPGTYIEDITNGQWKQDIHVEINRLVVSGNYDLIISIGQVVPHEVVGMSNHAKNLFVGVGGSQMINCSHMIGAVYGMENMMGKDHTPVRKIFDYALTHYLKDLPVLYVLTVTTVHEQTISTHGVFIGQGRKCLEEAIQLSQKKNIEYVPKPIKKCIAFLEPREFTSTWVGNKSIYRTRMAIAHGGELIVLAPGVEKFGEDPAIDALIRKYGYRGRRKILEDFQKPENQDLRDNMGAAAHMIHSSPDGHFTITYAVKNISQDEIEAVGFHAASYDQLAIRYDPYRMTPGLNIMPDGEEVFYIPNPALGLWTSQDGTD